MRGDREELDRRALAGDERLLFGPGGLPPPLRAFFLGMTPRNRQGERPTDEIGWTRWPRPTPLSRRAAGSGVSGGTSGRFSGAPRNRRKAARSLTSPLTLPRS